MTISEDNFEISENTEQVEPGLSKSRKHQRKHSKNKQKRDSKTY